MAPSSKSLNTDPVISSCPAVYTPDEAGQKNDRSITDSDRTFVGHPSGPVKACPPFRPSGSALDRQVHAFPSGEPAVERLRFMAALLRSCTESTLAPPFP
jgi:hypothetical protein